MDLRLESQYEEAKLTWASKEKQLAVFLLKDLEQKISLALESPATPGVDKQSLKSMHPLVLSKLGKWSLELRSESSSDLLNKYFYKSVKLYEGLPTPGGGVSADRGEGWKGLERGHRVFGAYASLALHSRSCRRLLSPLSRNFVLCVIILPLSFPLLEDLVQVDLVGLAVPIVGLVKVLFNSTLLEKSVIWLLFT